MTGLAAPLGRSILARDVLARGELRRKASGGGTPSPAAQSDHTVGVGVAQGIARGVWSPRRDAMVAEQPERIAA